MNTDRVILALNVAWGWAERLERGEMVARADQTQAAAELKDAVVALKEELAIAEPGPAEIVEVATVGVAGTVERASLVDAARPWPVAGGPEAWPVYRGSDAHVRDGEGWGVDLGNRVGLPWTALQDGTVVLVFDDGNQAGKACDVEWQQDGHTYKARWCHAAEIIVTQGQQVKAGEVLGQVGFSGLCIPRGPAGAHLHLAMWRDGERIKPEAYLLPG